MRKAINLVQYQSNNVFNCIYEITRQEPNPTMFINKTFETLNMRRLHPQANCIEIIHFNLKCGFLIQITVLHVARAACSYYDVTSTVIMRSQVADDEFSGFRRFLDCKFALLWDMRQIMLKWWQFNWWHNWTFVVFIYIELYEYNYIVSGRLL